MYRRHFSLGWSMALAIVDILTLARSPGSQQVQGCVRLRILRSSRWRSQTALQRELLVTAPGWPL